MKTKRNPLLALLSVSGLVASQAFAGGTIVVNNTGIPQASFTFVDNVDAGYSLVSQGPTNGDEFDPQSYGDSGRWADDANANYTFPGLAPNTSFNIYSTWYAQGGGVGMAVSANGGATINVPQNGGNAPVITSGFTAYDDINDTSAETRNFQLLGTGVTDGGGNLTINVTKQSGASYVRWDCFAVAATPTFTNLYWDGTSGTANGASEGGSGTWDTSTTNWDNGTSVAWGNDSFYKANLGGAAGIVTIAAASITANELVISTSGYTLSAANSVINGPVSITAGGSLTLDTSGTLGIASAISGPGSSIIKTGTGTLTFSTSNAYDGGTDVQQGTLVAGNNGIGSGTLDIAAGATVESKTVYGLGSYTGTINNAGALVLGTYASVNSPLVLDGATVEVFASPYDSNYQGAQLYNGNITVIGDAQSVIQNNDADGTNYGIHLLSVDKNDGNGVLFDVADGAASVDLEVSAILANESGDAGSAAGALTKTGAGTMALSGLNTYTGSTTVNDGTLIVTGQIAADSTVFLNDDTTLGVTAGDTSPAISTTRQIAIGDYLVSGSGANTVTFAAVNSTTVPVVSAGTLYIDKPMTVHVTSVIPLVGLYPLFKGVNLDSVSGEGAVIEGTLPGNVTASIFDNTATDGTIYLDVTAVTVTPIQWTGFTNGVWDINTTNNWTASPFLEGDIVTFDDSATGTTDVTLDIAVNPSVLTFANETKNYTLSGTGAIAGFTGMTKTGAGNLAITTNNTYTGAVVISGGGTVTVGDGGTNGSLGGTGSITLDGGILELNRSDAQVLARTMVGTGGTLVKSGSGTLAMTAANNTCDITVNGGTLVASGGGWATSFAAGKLITVNAGATLETPGYHSMGSFVGGGDVPIVDLNGGNWLLNHEQYIRTLTMTAGTTTGVPGNDGLRALPGAVYTSNAAATSSTIGSQLNLVNSLSLVVDDGTAADDLVISGLIINAGGITKTGAGKVVFSAENTYTGPTVVDDGIVVVNGTSIADTGRLEINGSGKVEVTESVDPVVEVVDTLWIDGTQMAAGTYGAPGSGATNTDGTHFAGAGVVQVTTAPPAGYDEWAGPGGYNLTGDDALRTSDPDGDGFTNLQEFLFGSSPVEGNGSLVTTTSTGGNLVLRWLQRQTPGQATYTLLESTTLGAGSWVAVGSPVPAVDDDQAAAPTNYEYWKVTLPIAAGKDFYRIEGVEN
ncbi:MAG: autotransporter-associated beta strand repeat-containing protein [Akkermansiaceae bacterium]|nr:autotransporter-associated beta strand repeat-containing protein [Akkermansiaceae bacterium]